MLLARILVSSSYASSTLSKTAEDLEVDSHLALSIHLCSLAKSIHVGPWTFPREICCEPKMTSQKTLSLLFNAMKRKSDDYRRMDFLVRLDRIFQELQAIRNRLDDIESMISEWRPQPLNISEQKLLSLPDNLRKSYLVVASKGECCATEVSNLTGRSRALESSYLNQLVRMGWLAKRRNEKILNFRTLTVPIEAYELLQHTPVKNKTTISVNQKSVRARP